MNNSFHYRSRGICDASWRCSLQRGVATLTVVMVLFFVMALVAAYSGRNMVFEQRTATNQLRSTQALEAAQAGLEWALSLLNAGRISAACTASASVGDTTFRQRYLIVDATTSAITRRVRTTAEELLPTCVSNGAGWTCDCPVDGAVSVAAPSGPDVFPAFRVRFLDIAGQPGIVRIEVNGCTRLDDSCLNFPASGSGGEGRATVAAMIALKSGLSTPPTTAVMARGAVSGAISIYNTNVAASGMTVQSGAAITIPTSSLFTIAGTPSERSILENDISLAPSALPVDPWPIGDRLFATVFAMWPSTYRDQPAALRADCGLGQCTAASLKALASLNPGRVIWVNGDLTVGTADDIGSAANPVVLVVTGDIIFTSPATIFGVIYGGRSSVATPSFNITGPGSIRGAVIAEHALVGVASSVITYDKSVIDLLRFTSGSMVMVPGSWRDF